VVGDEKICWSDCRAEQEAAVVVTCLCNIRYGTRSQYLYLVQIHIMADPRGMCI
jgi:hypothetical protein